MVDFLVERFGCAPWRSAGRARAAALPRERGRRR
jgi:hypothetical protein